MDTKPVKAATLGNAVTDFIDSQTLGVGVVKKEAYRKHLTDFVLYLQRRELSPRAVSGYGQHMLDTGLHQNTVSERLRVLRRFLLWCFTSGLTTTRWHEHVSRVKTVPTPDPQIIKHEEYMLLRKMCLDPEQDFLIVLGYSTGLRLGDCCTLRWEHVDRAEQVIRKVLNKTSGSTGKSVSMPYSSGGDLHKWLEDLWIRRVDDGFISPGLAASYHCNESAVKQGMRRVFDRAGVVGKSFKHFRCTFESKLANSGMNIALAAKITGRSDTRSILRYVVPDMDSAREGVAKALELHHDKKMFA